MEEKWAIASQSLGVTFSSWWLPPELSLRLHPLLIGTRFWQMPRQLWFQRAKAELSDGSQANVNTFPINHSEVVIYPKTDDPLLKRDAFRTWQLIQLPAELGGDKNDVSAFKVYSAACLRTDSAFNTLAILEGGITRSNLCRILPNLRQYCNSNRLMQ